MYTLVTDNPYKSTIIKIALAVFIIFVVYSLYKFYMNSYEYLDTSNGVAAKDDQYFYDKMFNDVIYYPNIYDQDYATGLQTGKLQQTGWSQCTQECPGNCVEYGMTGDSYCFLDAPEDKVTQLPVGAPEPPTQPATIS